MRQKAAAFGAALGVMAISLTLGAATGSAAKAPASFYGVVPQTSLGSSDFDRMGKGKVGTVRSILSWSQMDPSAAAGDEDFSSFDPIVLDAARNNIDVLPFIYGTPLWVAKGLDNQKCGSANCAYFAPKSAAALDAWSQFVGEVVDRYGPNGTLWAEHPEVNADPIRVYQIWNEQNSKTFYGPKPSTKGYAKLLGAASDAITVKDPQAQIVLGGMAELAGSHKAIVGSKYLADLYKVNGVKDDFDGIAPHPYGATLDKVTSQVETYRKVMKKAGDSGADMYVTEVGAGSASGGNSLNRGTKGQATLLTEMYKYFLKHRNGFNIAQVDWFSWQDSKTSICSWCKTSGLLKTNGKAKPSYKAFVKLTGGSTG